jgi:spermidine dehydrogenase
VTVVLGARARRPTRRATDLIVVGAGISGLAAAWYFARPPAPRRASSLDNHDDFGGHARAAMVASAGAR